MSYVNEVRFKLREQESIQWQADIALVEDVLGRFPTKALVLMAVHIFAQLLDHLDLGALAKGVFK